MSGIAMDPQRRRLTVSQCDSIDLSAIPGGSDGRPTLDRLAESGLVEVFAKETIADAKACSIFSVTDQEGKAKGSFEEKATDILCPAECDAERPGELLKWARRVQNIDYSCRKGKKPESPNQDSFDVVLVEGHFCVYGVFDGHGPYGHEVSEIVRRDLVKRFLQDDLRFSDTETAMKNAFVNTQQQLTEQRDSDFDMSGSTATLVYQDVKNDVLWVAHAGDSRCALQKHVGSKSTLTALTIDHKPNNPEEKERIENSNPPGRVIFDGFYNHRVFAKDGMYPGLNMSRALGDILAHRQAGLTAMPDVKRIDLKKEREGVDRLILYVCTDGVWEFVQDEDMHDIMKESLESPFGTPDVSPAGALAKESYDRWMKDSDGEVSDDITAIVVELFKK